MILLSCHLLLLLSTTLIVGVTFAKAAATGGGAANSISNNDINNNVEYNDGGYYDSENNRASFLDWHPHRTLGHKKHEKKKSLQAALLAELNLEEASKQRENGASAEDDTDDTNTESNSSSNLNLVENPLDNIASDEEPKPMSGAKHLNKKQKKMMMNMAATLAAADEDTAAIEDEDEDEDDAKGDQFADEKEEGEENNLTGSSQFHINAEERLNKKKLKKATAAIIEAAEQQEQTAAAAADPTKGTTTVNSGTKINNRFVNTHMTKAPSTSSSSGQRWGINDMSSAKGGGYSAGSKSSKTGGKSSKIGKSQNPATDTPTYSPTSDWAPTDATFSDSFEIGQFPDYPWNVSSTIDPQDDYSEVEYTPAVEDETHDGGTEQEDVRNDDHSQEGGDSSSTSSPTDSLMTTLPPIDAPSEVIGDKEINWARSTEQAKTGTHSLKSPNMYECGDMANVTLYIEKSWGTPGKLTFSYYCQDRPSQGGLQLFVNNKYEGSLSGMNDIWKSTFVMIPSTELPVQVTWSYVYDCDDNTTSAGNAFIDDVYYEPDGTSKPTSLPSISPVETKAPTYEPTPPPTNTP